jgi:SAM-dependent methyltransferase
MSHPIQPETPGLGGPMTGDLAEKSQAHHARVVQHFDAYADERHEWRRRNAYFYKRDLGALQTYIPKGARILELGCGNGDLLAALEPSAGLGVDISPRMIEQARQRHPDLRFEVLNVEDEAQLSKLTEPVDFIVLSDLIGLLFDVQALLRALHRLMAPHTRLVVSYHNRWWEPLFHLMVKLGMAMPRPQQNWFALRELRALLALEHYDVIRTQRRELSPRPLLGLGTLLNRFVAPLPLVNALCWRTHIVARSRLTVQARPASVTVLIPCRNERGNIEACVTRTPDMGPDTEILFVEGHSRDGTYEECLRVKEAHPDRKIRVLQQTGKGKGDAVRLGFEQAAGDIVMIVDSDLAVPPEYMPRVYEALASGEAEFVNCSRLVYPMEKGAMRTLNYIANRLFAVVLSYLLDQSLSDTLCGTKALYKADYEKIQGERERLGGLDPFGDFDLIFGAALHNLRIVEVPVRYQARDYGEPQISRFSDGWRLFKLVGRAFLDLKGN